MKREILKRTITLAYCIRHAFHDKKIISYSIQFSGEVYYSFSIYISNEFCKTVFTPPPLLR